MVRCGIGGADTGCLHDLAEVRKGSREGAWRTPPGDLRLLLGGAAAAQPRVLQAHVHSAELWEAGFPHPTGSETAERWCAGTCSEGRGGGGGAQRGRGHGLVGDAGVLEGGCGSVDRGGIVRSAARELGKGAKRREARRERREKKETMNGR